MKETRMPDLKAGKTDGNPYAAAPDCAFWRRAVSRVPWNILDPMIRDIPIIDRLTRIVSAGSCFAQNLAKFIRASGYNYHVTEAPVGIATPLYSARYGNIYTSRQLLQLFQRAFGRLDDAGGRHVWKRREDMLWVDAFRPSDSDPRVEVDEVRADRERHLAAVRQAFKEAEAFVFTLGLTECWERREDGMVYPAAPGVFNREFDPDDFVFRNMTTTEVTTDFVAFVRELRAVNPAVEIIVTVSPVPLIATYTDSHVLTANCRSKSILRAAAAEICDICERTHYFPAYEIFTGPHSTGRLYERNLRDTTAAGVNLAMRCFMRHFGRKGVETPGHNQAETDDYRDVVCEPDDYD